MEKSCFTADAHQVMEKFLSFWPVMSKAFHEHRLLEAIEYRLLKEGGNRVTKDLVINALAERYPSFETFILALKNPERVAAIMNDQKSIDEHKPLIKITRWKLPSIKTPGTVKDVFALLAGPRTGGNTDCIMDALLDGAAEASCIVEKLGFSQLNISPCIGCLKCQDEKPDTLCAIKDDMVYVYKRFLECDAFVLGFPVYTARENAQTAIFFDRLKALSIPGEHKKRNLKPGALVVTWGWPSQYLYKEIIHNTAFLIRHFGVEVAEVVTGCGFWDAYYKKGTARRDSNGMAEARVAGSALVQLHI